MNKGATNIFNRKALILYAKIAACILIAAVSVLFFIGSAASVQKTGEDYSFLNTFKESEATEHFLYEGLTQSFSARGEKLTQVKLYVGRTDPDAEKITVTLSDDNGVAVKEITVAASELVLGWNSIELLADGLSLGEVYDLSFSADPGSNIFVVTDKGIAEDSCLERCYLGGVAIDGALAVGMSFVNENISSGYIERTVIDLALVLSLTAMALFVVVKFEDCVACFKRGCSAFNWIYAVVFSVLYTTQYDPLDPARTSVLEFARNIGNGIMYDYDVSRVLKNFSVWFSVFAVCLPVFLLFTNYARATFCTDVQCKAWKYTDNIAVLALVSTAICAFSFFYNESLAYGAFSYSTVLIGLILLSSLAYIVFKLDERIAPRDYQLLLLGCFALAYPVAALCGLPWSDGALLACIQTVFFAAVIAALKFVKPIGISYENKRILLVSIATVASTVPFMLSFYIELVNVLNRHGVFVAAPRAWFAIGMIIPVSACVAVAYLMRTKKISVSNPKAFIYPALIFGIAALSVQVPLTAVYTTDLFESANYSVLISDFLLYGDIPIVQHYGGHMMSGVWEGIFYGVLNGDFSGAGFNPYSQCLIPFVVLLFYWFVKTVLDEDAAFVTALFLPFLPSWEYFGLGILIVFAVLAFVRKNTYFRAVLLWLACVWVALYRLDLGANFIIASVIALAYYIVSKRNFKAAKQLGITLVGYAAVFGSIWLVLCLVKGVNPITRIFEFLAISASNQNWAYFGIGNNSLAVYSWVYLVLPFAAIAALVYTAISKRFREELGVEKLMLIILMGASFLSNLLSRSLVRHSIEEMAVSVCVFSGYAFFATFATFKTKKQIFVPMFALLITVGNLFITTANPNTETVADTASTQMSEYGFVDSWSGDFWEEIAEREQIVDRVQMDPEMVSQLYPVKNVLDKILNEDETYVDFSNITVTYTYFERQNPVYVSQSPLQLSGEYTQECFIEQIGSDIQKNPVCLLPADSYHLTHSLDGINNSYRYYKVAEFIYQNYVPLCTVGRIAVWCLSERYDDMKLELSSGECEELEILSSGAEYDISDCIAEAVEDGLKLTGNGSNPKFEGISELFDLTPFVGTYATVRIDYSASNGCYFKLYYTTEKNEKFSEQKSITLELSESGTAAFTVPITEYTELCLSIPNGESATVEAFSVRQLDIEFIDYCYDPPYFHSYNVNLLPQLWAEADQKEAVGGTVLDEMVKENGIWMMDPVSSENKANGNYLLLRLYYKGTDVKGLTGDDDEVTTSTVRIGKISEGEFVDMYSYTITVKEGAHDYLIRVSCDYIWFCDEINAVLVEESDALKARELILLEGD